MTIKDIIECIEAEAPLIHQEPYDNSGLLVGDPIADCNKALLCLDITEEVIEEAVKENCDLIIAHHPVIFGGLKKLNGANATERIVMKAIKNDIALYAAHTNLDNVHTGVNAMICDKIGLKDTRVMVPKTGIISKLYTYAPEEHIEAIRNAIFKAGGGHIGNYEECSFMTSGQGTFKGMDGADPFVGEVGTVHTENEIKVEVVFPSHLQRKVVNAMLDAHPYEEVAYEVLQLENRNQYVGAGMIGLLDDEMSTMEFMEHLKKSMDADVIRYAGLTDDNIKKVAVCGGSGSFLLRDAIAQGADIFVTADFKYHQFFEHENMIVIADIGHYESEHFTSLIYERQIREKFPNFALCFTSVNTNPIKYFK